MEKQKYVVGFAFNIDKSKILMIKKTKPIWQFGLLNGVGGKIESDEKPISAMIREFKEETDLDTVEDNWFYHGVYSNDGFDLHIYYASFSDEFLNKFHTMTEENVELISIQNLIDSNYSQCVDKVDEFIIGILNKIF